MLLNNNTLQLRALEPEDLDTLYLWENTSSLWVQGNSLAPYSRMALRKYINETQLTDIYESKQLRLMIDLIESKVSIGVIDLYDFDIRNSRAGVGILIDTKYRNKGYASQALRIINEYVFDFLGLHQLYAHILESNKTSIHLFENAGYRKTGTLTDWVQTKKGFFENVYIVQLNNTIDDK